MNFPNVRRVIDTRQWSDIPGIGRIEDGVLTTWHVSDAPEKVLALLRRRGNLVSSYGEKGKHAGLGPGLYFSGVPEYWLGRLRGKWNFLVGLPRDRLERLLEALSTEVEKQRASCYISATEYDYAGRLLTGVWGAKLEPDVLTALAGQPYNIAFWTEDYLRAQGIRASAQPRAVEVGIVGQLAELKVAADDHALYRSLRKLGVVGAYTVSNFSTSPELVLWNGRAVVRATVVTL